jgi:hypothetical protein
MYTLYYSERGKNSYIGSENKVEGIRKLLEHKILGALHGISFTSRQRQYCCSRFNGSQQQLRWL